MGTLRIRLFGHFSVERAQQPLGALHAPRVQELLCYLLLHRVGHARESLAGRLWPEESIGVARKALRQALWQLQRTLDDGGTFGDPSVLLVHADTIAVNDAATVWLDTALMDSADAKVRETPGVRLDADQAQMVRDAVALYRGDLLEGWFQDWCIFERERLVNLYLGLANKLMGYCEANQRYEEGLEYGMRILRVDPARERAHWRMMRLHYLLGDRVGALRQYQRCVAALQDELGVGPSARTQALYEQICADQSGSRARRFPPFKNRPRRSAALPLRRTADTPKTATRRALDAIAL